MAEIYLKDVNLAAKAPRVAIARAEADYFEKVRRIAEKITENVNIKIVLLAGPSGSGKTTTANLVADAIRASGERALVVSLDDFYRAQDDLEYPRQENGELDYECPDALNIPQLTDTLEKIASDKPFEIPKYDFKCGKPVKKTRYDSLGRGCVIIEGLHALNPRISDLLPKEKILKVFVSVSTNINVGDERIISGRKIRFIRRLVRDSIYRGSSAERTLSMWHGVLAAEDIYLYPYKESADIAFDTFHVFELGAMKHFAKKLIPKSLAQCDPYANIVYSAIELIDELDYRLIPETSLIREFIPGGIYESLY